MEGLSKESLHKDPEAGVLQQAEKAIPKKGVQPKRAPVFDDDELWLAGLAGAGEQPGGKGRSSSSTRDPSWSTGSTAAGGRAGGAAVPQYSSSSSSTSYSYHMEVDFAGIDDAMDMVDDYDYEPVSYGSGGTSTVHVHGNSALSATGAVRPGLVGGHHHQQQQQQHWGHDAALGSVDEADESIDWGAGALGSPQRPAGGAAGAGGVGGGGVDDLLDFGLPPSPPPSGGSERKAAPAESMPGKAGARGGGTTSGSSSSTRGFYDGGSSANSGPSAAGAPPGQAQAPSEVGGDGGARGISASTPQGAQAAAPPSLAATRQVLGGVDALGFVGGTTVGVVPTLQDIPLPGSATEEDALFGFDFSAAPSYGDGPNGGGWAGAAVMPAQVPAQLLPYIQQQQRQHRQQQRRQERNSGGRGSGSGPGGGQGGVQQDGLTAEEEGQGASRPLETVGAMARTVKARSAAGADGRSASSNTGSTAAPGPAAVRFRKRGANGQWEEVEPEAPAADPSQAQGRTARPGGLAAVEGTPGAVGFRRVARGLSGDAAGQAGGSGVNAEDGGTRSGSGSRRSSSSSSSWEGGRRDEGQGQVQGQDDGLLGELLGSGPVVRWPGGARRMWAEGTETGSRYGTGRGGALGGAGADQETDGRDGNGTGGGGFRWRAEVASGLRPRGGYMQLGAGGGGGVGAAGRGWRPAGAALDPGAGVEGRSLSPSRPPPGEGKLVGIGVGPWYWYC